VLATLMPCPLVGEPKLRPIVPMLCSQSRCEMAVMQKKRVACPERFS
jgi:hypothetical protein